LAPFENNRQATQRPWRGAKKLMKFPNLFSVHQP
jgi:hypothetical protein